VSVIDTKTNTVIAITTIPNPGSSSLGIAVSPDGSRVYLSDELNVTVVNTATSKVIATIHVGSDGSLIGQAGVAVTPDGGKVYVASADVAEHGFVSVIDTATNKVTAKISLVTSPLETGQTAFGVAVSPNGSKVYVTRQGITVQDPGSVFVIDATTNTVVGIVPVGPQPTGVAVSPDGNKVYVTSSVTGGDGVSVIDAATNTVTTTIPDDKVPIGVAITPDGKKVYVANFTGSLGENGTVSVIDAATNTVTATVMVGPLPVAFGIFIQTTPRFAGTPGKSNCYGKSVSALVRQYRGLNAAAAALGYRSVKALQTAIMEFCEG
jgi:YVTN family beta-propeller protein